MNEDLVDREMREVGRMRGVPEHYLDTWVMYTRKHPDVQLGVLLERFKDSLSDLSRNSMADMLR